VQQCLQAAEKAARPASLGMETMQTAGPQQKTEAVWLAEGEGAVVALVEVGVLAVKPPVGVDAQSLARDEAVALGPVADFVP